MYLSIKLQDIKGVIPQLEEEKTQDGKKCFPSYLEIIALFSGIRIDISLRKT